MSDNKNVPSKQTADQPVQLHDNGLQAGSLIGQAVSRLSKDQADHLLVKAGEEALRLEVKQHETNIEYVHAKKTVEDHIDAFNMLEKGGKLTRQSVTTEVKSGNSNMRIESKSGAACFVATAAYQDPSHPDVIFLRSFRDNTLAKSNNGRAFIEWYWHNGPRLAKIVNRYQKLRPLAKITISSIVKILQVSLRKNKS